MMWHSWLSRQLHDQLIAHIFTVSYILLDLSYVSLSLSYFISYMSLSYICLFLSYIFIICTSLHHFEWEPPRLHKEAEMHKECQSFTINMLTAASWTTGSICELSPCRQTSSLVGYRRPVRLSSTVCKTLCEQMTSMNQNLLRSSQLYIFLTCSSVRLYFCGVPTFLFGMWELVQICSLL